MFFTTTESERNLLEAKAEVEAKIATVAIETVTGITLRQ